jgi:class 3 adenylate cyclase
MAHRGDKRKVAAQAQPPPRPPAGPDHRIGDAERQQAIEVLRAHTGAGRLTLEEFSDLAGDVYAAQTFGELEAVGRKLPPGLIPAPGPAPAPNRPADSVPPTASVPDGDAGRRRNVIAVMCGAHPRGRWRPASRLRAVAFWGGAHVDLRDAELPGPVIDIDAWAVMGGLTITVAEGTRVELDGPVIMGGADDRTARTGPAPADDAPLVRVHARVMWGGLEVRNPSRKKRFKRALTAEADRIAARIDLRDQRSHSVLEIPQRILDELDAVLNGRVEPRDAANRREHGPRWSPPVPPQPPRPPWSSPPRDNRSPRAAGEPLSGTLTMMITDVVDSTQLAEKLGDRRWVGVMREHNELVRDQVAHHDGTEVKALGDGFLVVFPSARRAILAAVDVQRGLCRYREAHPETPITVRIGLHTGEIVDLDGDVLGQNVVVAARIADQAAPGEIVVSSLTRDLTVAGGDLTFGPPEDVELKGLSQRWRVHRVSWASTAPATPAP